VGGACTGNEVLVDRLFRQALGMRLARASEKAKQRENVVAVERLR